MNVSQQTEGCEDYGYPVKQRLNHIFEALDQDKKIQPWAVRGGSRQLLDIRLPFSFSVFERDPFLIIGDKKLLGVFVRITNSVGREEYIQIDNTLSGSWWGKLDKEVSAMLNEFDNWNAYHGDTAYVPPEPSEEDRKHSLALVEQYFRTA